MTQDELKALAKELGAEHQVPWEVLYAICMKESSGNEFAIRHERHYKWLLGQDLDKAEELGQKTSWGLMQVMGAVAREHGYQGQFTGLWAPRTGMTYGIKHLKKLKARYGTWPHTLAAYNAGSPRMRDGKYENQYYVDKVLYYWSSVEEQVPLKASET